MCFILFIVNPNEGSTLATLPILTQCQFDENSKKIEMVVVIRDPDGIIKTNLTSDADELLKIKFGDKNEVCNNEKKQLNYFKVIRD